MRREQLEHVIRAAGDLIGDDELVVIGSQAILASFSEEVLPPETTMSMEADLVPLDDPDQMKADLVDGAIGEESMFHELHGYYAQGLDASAATLPEGWRDRLVPMHNENTRGVTGWCLEPQDLWIAKAAAGREKDARYCRALLARGLVDPEVISARLGATDLDGRRRERLLALLSG